jgi:ankyrin repeat protein
MEGTEGLVKACLYGDIQRALLHLEDPGVEVNKMGKKGVTPLGAACFAGCLEMVRVLLKTGGVDPNRGSKSYTPLSFACWHGHIEVVKALLCAPGVDYISPGVNGQTILHQACVSGQASMVALLLSLGDPEGPGPRGMPRFDVNQGDSSGNTPLMISCLLNHLEVVRTLLDDERVLLTGGLYDGNTILHVACLKGDEELVRCVLGSSSQERFGGLLNGEGLTPLLIAIEKNNPGAVRALASHPETPINTPGPNGYSPLFLACRDGRHHIVEALLGHPALEVNAPSPLFLVPSEKFGTPEALEGATPLGWTPLHLAVSTNSLACAGLLLRDPRIDPNAVDDLGNTPLHIAAACNHVHIASLLLSHRATLITLRNADHATPLQMAVSCKHKETAEVIRKRRRGAK